MSLSRLYESKSQSGRPLEGRKYKPPDPQPSWTRFIKQLSQIEMEERRSKGLCFNNDEPFTRGHKCKRLFWLELVEDEDGNAAEAAAIQEEQSEISLNAIVGISSMQNMLIKGKYDSCTV